MVTNDIYTDEDARFLRSAGVLDPERIRAVETGACPHTAIRDDVTQNLLAVEDLERDFAPVDVVLVESGGDNLTATFSPGAGRRAVLRARRRRRGRRGPQGRTRHRPRRRARGQQDRPRAVRRGRRRADGRRRRARPGRAGRSCRSAGWTRRRSRACGPGCWRRWPSSAPGSTWRRTRGRWRRTSTPTAEGTATRRPGETHSPRARQSQLRHGVDHGRGRPGRRAPRRPADARVCCGRRWWRPARTAAGSACWRPRRCCSAATSSSSTSGSGQARGSTCSTWRGRSPTTGGALPSAWHVRLELGGGCRR